MTTTPKRKPGRPKGSITGPRPGSKTRELRVRVTPEEMATIDAMATQEDLTRSALVRQRLGLS